MTIGLSNWGVAKEPREAVFTEALVKVSSARAGGGRRVPPAPASCPPVRYAPSGRGTTNTPAHRPTNQPYREILTNNTKTTERFTAIII